MVSRKINTDAIDENLLIASIGKSKIGTTTASILDGASQSQVKDTEEKEEVGRKSQCSQTDKSPISRKPPKASSEKLRFGILQAKRDKDSSMRLYQP